MKNKSSFIIIEFLIWILLLVSVFEYLLNLFVENTAITYLYMAQMFGSFVLSAIVCFKRLGYLHIFSLYHITLFIFAFGTVFASLFMPMIYNYKEVYYPGYALFSESICQKVFLLYTVFVCVTYIVFWIIYYKKDCKNMELKVPQTNETYLKIAKYIMIAFLPFALLYSFKTMSFGSGDEGRALLYQTGSNASLGMPLYIRIGNMLFTAGYFILVASCPPKKTFITFFFIYFITLIPILLMGERSDVILPLLFALWYMTRLYDIKIPFRRLALIGFVIITISYILVFTRQGEMIEGLSLSTIIFGFLVTSSSGFKVLAYYILYKNEVAPHPYPFVLDSFIGGLVGVSGQSLETLDARASIGHHLVYTINPNYYLSGSSMGTTYIAECFEFGLFGVILGAILFVIIMYFVDVRIWRNRFLLIFLPMLFGAQVFSPRSSLFISALDIIKYGGLTFVLVASYNLFKGKKLIYK